MSPNMSVQAEGSLTPWLPPLQYSYLLPFFERRRLEKTTKTGGGGQRKKKEKEEKFMLLGIMTGASVPQKQPETKKKTLACHSCAAACVWVLCRYERVTKGSRR